MGRKSLAWTPSPLTTMVTVGAVPLLILLLLVAIFGVEQEELIEKILSDVLGYYIGAYLALIVYIGQKQLAREFSPRSNRRLLKFQRRVHDQLKCFGEKYKAQVHEGDPDAGYDFVLCRNENPWVLIETKSKDTWKYPTTKIVFGTINRLKCAMEKTAADHGIIVVDSKKRPDPFELQLEKIELCTLGGIEHALKSLANETD